MEKELNSPGSLEGGKTTSNVDRYVRVHTRTYGPDDGLAAAAAPQ